MRTLNTRIQQKVFKINDLMDREEILEVLSNLYTDEDFSGGNGEEYTFEEAIEQGFNSSQEYVISVLKNSGLEGKALINAFFHQWLNNDNSCVEWQMTDLTVDESKSTVVFAVAILYME